jgi:hypothetical protein
VKEFEIFFLPAGGLIFGFLAGCGFGMLQDERVFASKFLRTLGYAVSSWTGISDPISRSILLLVMLTFFQAMSTFIIDTNGFQWIVSGGILLGYATTLIKQLRRRSPLHP